MGSLTFSSNSFHFELPRLRHVQAVEDIYIGAILQHVFG